MSEILTKSRARNVFYGGSLFFTGVFAAADLAQPPLHRHHIDGRAAADR